MEHEFHRVESLLSRFQPDSELSRLNRAGAMRVGPELLEVTALSLEARERTGGRFDPTVHDALVAAGYDRSFAAAGRRARPPARGPAQCAGAVAVDIAASTVALEDGFRLDFGGIAKGWAVDRALASLSAHGPALVNAGGDVAGAGRPWHVGVDTPDRVLTLELDGGALATSGRDRRRWSSDGVERHHLIDPSTGAALRGRPADRDRRRRDCDGCGGAREVALPRRRPAAGARGGRRARPPGGPRRTRWRDGARRRARMRTDPTFWIIARASGLVAYALLTASVLAGIVLKARPFGRSPRPAAITDVHRFLALLGLAFLGVHATALVLDRTVDISLAALVVPGLVPYRPFWTALGVVAAELMVLVYVSFSLRSRIGVRAWRRLHWFTYGLFALATVHGLAAGTDTSRPWALPFYGAAVGAVLAAAGWRALVPPTQGGSRHVPSRGRPDALHRLRPVRADRPELTPSGR